MSDVTRFVREIEEVVYTVGEETVRKAILTYLNEEHGAAFNESTTVQFCSGNSVAVVTRFEPTPKQAGDVVI